MNINENEWIWIRYAPNNSNKLWKMPLLDEFICWLAIDVIYCSCRSFCHMHIYGLITSMIKLGGLSQTEAGSTYSETNTSPIEKCGRSFHVCQRHLTACTIYLSPPPIPAPNINIIAGFLDIFIICSLVCVMRTGRCQWRRMNKNAIATY